jgi:hypothetical protein
MFFFSTGKDQLAGYTCRNVTGGFDVSLLLVKNSLPLLYCLFMDAASMISAQHFPREHRDCNILEIIKIYVYVTGICRNLLT